MRSIYLFLFVVCSIPVFLYGEDWGACKKTTLLQMSSIPGWCTDEKAHVMMDIIKHNQCNSCVEIGVFSGKSLLPIAKALQFNGKGKIYAIDPWDPDESIKGFDPSDPNYAWWNSLDYKIDQVRKVV